jgi:DNA-binding beta-propeller fold protein YncE
VVAVLPIPQVAGVVLAPDLRKVYAADSNDNIVFVINEATLNTASIELHKNDSPDALAYDQTDHLVFVGVPGAPANPDESKVVDRKNQNLNVIDALKDKVVAIIPLGVDGQWGDAVGHVKFDPGLHRIFVVVQQLADPDSPKQSLLPPPGTAWLVEVDPVAYRVITRMKLPNACITPHGMTIDTEQHIAFIACIDSNPPSLYQVDLRTLHTFPKVPWPLPIKPDMLALDRPLHLLYVACGSGIALFQEEGRSLRSLGSYTYGVNTHSIAVNEETHEIYLPLVRVGGRPVLRIMRYNPDGVV